LHAGGTFVTREDAVTVPQALERGAERLLPREVANLIRHPVVNVPLLPRPNRFLCRLYGSNSKSNKSEMSIAG
jgi:hypothetical protein